MISKIFITLQNFSCDDDDDKYQIFLIDVWEILLQIWYLQKKIRFLGLRERNDIQ